MPDRTAPLLSSTWLRFAEATDEALRPSPPRARRQYPETVGITGPITQPNTVHYGRRDSTDWWHHGGVDRMRSRIHPQTGNVEVSHGNDSGRSVIVLRRDMVVDAYGTPGADEAEVLRAARDDNYARVFTPPEVSRSPWNDETWTHRSPLQTQDDVTPVRIDPALLDRLTPEQSAAYYAAANGIRVQQVSEVTDRNGNRMLLNEAGQESEDL